MADISEARLLNDQLCVAVYHANKLFNHFYTKTLRPFHLTYAQYITLCALWERDGQNVRELGEQLALDSGTLTPLLRRLETNGWVHRQRSKKDERQVNIFLTAMGQEKRDEIYATVTECMSLLEYEDSDYAKARADVRDLADRLAKIDDHQLLRVSDNAN
ncbi:MarR family winged helix-turn-helix transcriptional regulator [Furfurilactobacillus siliginis]|uniref:HTH-type transcriptional regulator SarZ n=1 Tax=Furfurilactobacillus siliginis TaxID=348151 RepID=A0A0R2KZ94_9LACO|nr:MarR family transcriptional regulator [Furfurilactobacillus siliginis]KRN94686.1 MarR family transcriptional regulator [Furfurilactobacillus siliginis]GEK28398.1 MarR family transcriptional regulator [Furfurilactobacillus siliginis]